MDDPLAGLESWDVVATARVEGDSGDGVWLTARLEDRTQAPGGEVPLHVSRGAAAAYGLSACVDEVERWVNRQQADMRLAYALALGSFGPFRVEATPDTGPWVVPPVAAPYERAA